MGSSSVRRRNTVNESDRVFSLSSVSYMRVCSYSPDIKARGHQLTLLDRIRLQCRQLRQRPLLPFLHHLPPWAVLCPASITLRITLRITLLPHQLPQIASQPKFRRRNERTRRLMKVRKRMGKGRNECELALGLINNASRQFDVFGNINCPPGRGQPALDVRLG